MKNILNKFVNVNVSTQVHTHAC